MHRASWFILLLIYLSAGYQLLCQVVVVVTVVRLPDVMVMIVIIIINIQHSLFYYNIV